MLSAKHSALDWGTEGLKLSSVPQDKVAMPPDPPQAQTVAAQLHMERAYDAGPGIAAKLPTVSNPVLLVTGGQDTVDPPANQAALVAGLPQSSLSRFPDAGHIVMFQARLPGGIQAPRRPSPP